MTAKKYLIVERGSVKAKKIDGIVHRIYYSDTKDPAVRADWEDEEKGTVLVQLQSGKMKIISAGGVTLRSF